MIKKETLIKFIDNKEKLGINYDWNKIYKAFKALKTPTDTYNPTDTPITLADILCLVSKRSKGKTTNWILIGMIMNLMYNTQIQYIRTSRDMIKPSIINKLFDVIKTYENGRYIKEMTGGEYNSIYHHWKKGYFCHINPDDGKMDKVSDEPFICFLSIDDHELYKSGYNAPYGDLIILDEFIEQHYCLTDFVDFWDLFRTIQRDRLSCKIIMLANTTDPNNMWFRELCISKDMKALGMGQHQLIDVNGTQIYLEYIASKLSNSKISLLTKYFGFAKDNPKMSHLVDNNNAWSFTPVPHIRYEEDDEYLDRSYRIRTGDECIQLELVHKPSIGQVVVYAHPCTQHYEDSVFLTLDEVKAPNEMWGFGYTKFAKYLWNLYAKNLFYYSDNETGAVVANYVKNCRQLRK